MTAEILEEIAVTLSELEDSAKIRGLIDKALAQRVPVAEIIEEGLRKGLDLVGKKYENGVFFLAELLYAGSIMNDALQMLRSNLDLKGVEPKGVVVLGTVRGDMHDIGKNIFKMFAIASGFEVHDLGVDVEPETFVDKLRETKAEILGLSSLLTTTLWEIKNVIEKLNKAGMRDGVKVLIGGNAVTKDFAREVGADEVALDAVEGVKICRRWVGK